MRDVIKVTMDDGASALVAAKGDEGMAFELKEFLLRGIQTLQHGDAIDLRMERCTMSPDQMREFQGG